jgi:hypothetical protein
VTGGSSAEHWIDPDVVGMQPHRDDDTAHRKIVCVCVCGWVWVGGWTHASLRPEGITYTPCCPR